MRWSDERGETQSADRKLFAIGAAASHSSKYKH
jgi:hypothetical protein